MTHPSYKEAQKALRTIVRHTLAPDTASEHLLADAIRVRRARGDYLSQLARLNPRYKGRKEPRPLNASRNPAYYAQLECLRLIAFLQSTADPEAPAALAAIDTALRGF